MKLEVNITKIRFFVLLGAFLVLTIAIGVFAYNDNVYNDPAVFGHSAGEIEGGVGGSIQSWQAVGITSITKSTTTWTTLDNMNLDINTGGGDLLIEFSAPFEAAGNRNVIGQVRILLDGNELVKTQTQEGDGSEQDHINMQWLEKGVPAGLHNVKIEWSGVNNGYLNNGVHQYGNLFKRVLTVLEISQEGGGSGIQTFGTSSIDRQGAGSESTLVSQGCTKLDNSDYTGGQWMACPSGNYMAAQTDDGIGLINTLCCPF
jgi:hypothetical protein